MKPEQSHSSGKPVVSRSKKQMIQFSISFVMSPSGRLVGGGIVVVLFTVIFPKSTELCHSFS